MQTTMKVSIFCLIILLVPCYHVMSQSVSFPVPTRTLTLMPTPTPTPLPVSPTSPFSHPLDCPFADTSLCDPLCPYINFECEPGLIPATRTFAQSEICEPLFVTEFTRTCSFVLNNGNIAAFKCPNEYGQQTALLCFPPNIPLTDDYCFCNNSAYPRYGVSGVPDVKFIGNVSNITENEGILTVCAAVGQLPEGISVNVTISTQAGTAIGGIDFENFFQEFLNLESRETWCVNISILKDAVDEVEEFFLLNIDLAYAPFDILVDTYNITITDSDIIGLGFEQEVVTVAETAGSVTVCVSTNVTLNGSRTASAVLFTQDVTAQADVDYLAVNVPLLFRINGDNRACVDISILPDIVVQDEYFDTFLVRLNSTSTSLFTPQVVVIIMDQDELYPFGDGVGDAVLTQGIVTNPRTSSPPLSLTPTFRFFSRDEGIIFVNTNGALSFNRSFNIPNPQPFPFSDFRLISPYWDNFETQRFGLVYYRNTTDLALLRRAQYHLQDIFPSARNFFPSYLFLATWDEVPEFGIAGDPNIANTFQTVLATDGEKSFVFFTYVSILWGEGAIGFDAGDGMRSLSLPGSQTTAALDIEDGSNVGVEGLYAYRVDLPEIIGPGDCGGQVGVIRLFNGSSASEGVVEYCDDSMWTPVCGDDWDEREAAVACRQLRFSGEGAAVFHEEVGSVTPLTIDFNCTGMENDLLECALNSSAGSGAPTQVNTLQPFASCLYLARVNCTAMQIGFEQDSYTVPETDGSVTVCVRMTTGVSTVPVTLAVLGTASAEDGIDYSTNASIVELVFEGAPQQECVKIDIIDDDLVEQNESFLVLLNTTLTSQTVSLDPQSVFVTIADDDRVEPLFTGASAGAIAGSVVAAIVAVLLLIGGLVLAVYYRRKKKREMEIRIMRIGVFSDMELAANPYLSQGGMVVHNPYIKQLPKERIIPSSSLRILKSIGQGEFGIVYKAHHVKDAMAMPTFVAVKTLKGFFDRERIAEMMRESVRMMDLNHPHVLSLNGVCLDAGPAPYIVMPFMANGSLLEYIKTEKKNLVFPDHSMQDTEEAHVARKRMADMCLQVAKGMEYLSSQNIIHRDLAARNCMIDAHFIIKVADFGLSESTYKKTYFRQKKGEAIKLPVKWLAPEALTEGIFSEKSDVWSYGVTCWEIFTGGRIPYPGVDPVSLPNLLENGLKLEKPKNAACSEELYFFMFRCWHTDPEERLSFTDLVRLMSQTLENLGDYMEVCTFGTLQEANKEAVDENNDDADGKGDKDDADSNDGDNDADERDDSEPIEKDKPDNAPFVDEDKL